MKRILIAILSILLISNIAYAAKPNIGADQLRLDSGLIDTDGSLKVYSKTETDLKLTDKADTSTVALKANSIDVYTKTDLDTTLEVGLATKISKVTIDGDTGTTGTTVNLVAGSNVTLTRTADTVEIIVIPTPIVNQTITVTAGETITAGQVVSIINDGGTMKAYNNPLTVSNEAESVFNSAETTNCSAVAIDTTRFLVAYAENDSYPRAIIGTVSGSNISWGSESAIFENVATTYLSTCKIATDKVLVCYKNGLTDGRMIVLSISNATISNGAPTTFDNNYGTYVSLITLDTDKALVCYNETESATKGQAKIITVSGTTPTPYPAAEIIGTEFNAANTPFISTSALSSTSVIVAYRDDGNSNYGTAQVLTIDGTTITPGTEYIFRNATSYQTRTIKMTATQAVITDCTASTTTARTANISGTAISYGVGIDASVSGIPPNMVYAIDTTKFVMTQQNTGMFSKVGTVSGTDISFSATSQFNVGASTYGVACYLGLNKGVFVYQDNPNTYGTAVLALSTSSYANVSGVSQGTYFAGSDSVILISGLDENQSGLITGAAYFLQSNYTLGITPAAITPTSLLNAGISGEIKIGVAKSATELIIDIDYK